MISSLLKRKKAALGRPQDGFSVYTLATTYSSAENDRSTIGATRLNFCVRDGNRCGPRARFTRNFKDMKRNRVATVVSLEETVRNAPAIDGQTKPKDFL